MRPVSVDGVMVVSWAGLASVGGPGGLLVVAGDGGEWLVGWLDVVGSPGLAGPQDTGAGGRSPLPTVSRVCVRWDAPSADESDCSMGCWWGELLLLMWVWVFSCSSARW